MSQTPNPFIRGYQNLHVVRTLCITYEDDSPPVWRQLHPSQAHLLDDQIAQFPCILCNDFALIGFLFVVFRIPYSPAIGVKVIATPWTDANLQYVEGITAEQLRREHQDKGMPESLLEVLHLAALADVRFLIFDADAPVLDGLPLYEE